MFLLHGFLGGSWRGVNSFSATIELLRVHRVHFCILTFNGRHLPVLSNDSENTHTYIYTYTQVLARITEENVKTGQLE